MDTRTVGDLRVLVPDIDPRDLDDTTERPGEELLEARVTGADWSHLELVDARLRLSHLLKVDLSATAWRNVTLHGCRLERVDFSSARLTGLTVERCEFIGCRMTGAQFADSTLKNVIFDDCRFDYAILDDVRSTGPTAWTGCGFAEATLTRCHLSSAAIRSCHLTKAELRECDLRGTDLRGSTLDGLQGVLSLRGVRLHKDQLPGLADIVVRELDIETADQASA